MLAAGSYRNKRKRARERIQQYRTVVNDKINQENGSILLHSLLEDHGNICHQRKQTLV